MVISGYQGLVKASQSLTTANLGEVISSIKNTTAKKAEAVTTTADTTAKEADTAATTAATIATELWNKVLAKNPIVLAVMAIMTLITVMTAVTKAISKAEEKQREKNDADIEAANAIQEEIDANNELCDSYLSTYEAYKKNEASKSDMIDATKNLTDVLNSEDIAVANLTGDYDKLTESILKQEQASNKKALKSAKEEANAAGDNLLSSAIKGKG